MWETHSKGWLLTFKIDGLGPKNRELSSMFGQEAKDSMLVDALDCEARCYVMPSSSQSDKSSIAAPMTVLVTFLQQEEINLDKFPDFAWATMEQALDPSFNVHAGVIARYCQEKSMASLEMLKAYGWTVSNMLIAIPLPSKLSTLRDWGADVASVYISMKGLLLKERRLQAPLPRRMCEPRDK